MLLYLSQYLDWNQEISFYLLNSRQLISKGTLKYWVINLIELQKKKKQSVNVIDTSPTHTVLLVL